MQHFTPVSAFFGELLIGLDAIVLMLFPSRIAGIAVIVGGLLGFDCREIVWRGGIRPWFDRGPAIGRLGAGRALPVVTVDALPPVVVVLAAFSSTLAGGSAAGIPAAGVCGLARLSARSLVTTLVLPCLPRTGYRAPSAGLVASRARLMRPMRKAVLSRRFVGVSRHEHWRNEVKAWCCAMVAGWDIPPKVF